MPSDLDEQLEHLRKVPLPVSWEDVQRRAAPNGAAAPLSDPEPDDGPMRFPVAARRARLAPQRRVALLVAAVAIVVTVAVVVLARPYQSPQGTKPAAPTTGELQFDPCRSMHGIPGVMSQTPTECSRAVTDYVLSVLPSGWRVVTSNQNSPGGAGVLSVFLTDDHGNLLALSLITPFPESPPAPFFGNRVSLPASDPRVEAVATLAPGEVRPDERWSARRTDGAGVSATVVYGRDALADPQPLPGSTEFQAFDQLRDLVIDLVIRGPVATNAVFAAPPSIPPSVTSVPNTDPTTRPPYCTGQTPTDASVYVGLSEAGAAELARLRGQIVRVASRDGVGATLTLDARPDRVDVEVSNGVITQACYG